MGSSKTGRIPSPIAILLAALVALALLCPAARAAHAPAPQKSILLLYSYGHGGQGIGVFDEGLLETLYANQLNVNDLYFEYLDLERNRGDALYAAELKRELERKYPKGKIDLVITVQQPALRFLLSEGAAIAPGVPAISLQAPPPSGAEAEDRHFYCMVAKFDVEGTVRLALDLFPRTRKVLVVVGSSDADRTMAKAVEKAVEEWKGKVDFEYTTGMALDEVLERASRATSGTVVLFTQFNKDSKGLVTVAYEVEGELVRAAAAPVFGLYDFNLRNGGVGGSVISVRGLGEHTAELALEILSGKAGPEKPVTLVENKVIPIFDWERISKWGGDPDKLPAGAVVQNRIPGLWESYRWYIVGALALFTLETALIAMLIAMRRRSLAAERLQRESEEKFAKAFLHAPLLMTISEVHSGAMLEVNDKFCEVTGYTREEVIGRTSLELGLITPEVREILIENLRSNGHVIQVEVRAAAKGGRAVDISLSAEIIKVGGLEKLLTISQDITDAKRAAEEANRLQEKLTQAQKMEAIGTLAGGIAHDFNNILGAILGYTELTLATLPEEGEQRENLQEVVLASLRAKELVQQILAFGRKKEKRTVEVDASRVVSEAMKLLVSVIPKNIRVEQEVDASAGFVRADPSELHQVVMNLCTNAYQAMALQDSGRLKVRLSRVRVDGLAAAAIPGLAPGDYLRLEVEDDGPGMDEATGKRVFEPYFTTKGPGKGTGLGLATVHGIVRAMGGAITLRSAPGEGTAFAVYMPRLEPGGPRAAESTCAPISHRKGNILLVDDEPGLARLGRRMLESFGYSVREFTDPVEAIRHFEVDPAGFDAIVTDQTMPRLTGAELIRRARAARPSIPAVMCTGFSDLIDEEGAKKLGVAAFVRKPYDRNALGAAVARALGGQAEPAKVNGEAAS